MDFQLADHGVVFSTRPRGRALRDELIQDLVSGEQVVLRMDGVLKVSQSFSDEFLAALIVQLGEDRVRIDGEVAPGVERVLDRALARRRLPAVDDLRAVFA